MATHSSILAWRIPMDRGVWRDTVHGVAKSRTRLTTQHMDSCLLSGMSVVEWEINNAFNMFF